MKDASFGVVPIHVENGTTRYLLVHQMKGHWGFPKGHADPGESAIQAAIRELAEETGITACRVIESPQFIEHYTIIKKSAKRIDKTVTFFIGHVDDPAVVPQPEEVQGYAWLTADKARERLTFPEARELFARVLSHLNHSKT